MHQADHFRGTGLNGRSLEDGLQLRNVSRPVIVLQDVENTRRQLKVAFVQLGKAVQVPLNEVRQVGGAFAQGRYLNFERA